MLNLCESYVSIGRLDDAARVAEEAHRGCETAGNLVFALDAAGTLASLREVRGSLHQAANDLWQILSVCGERLDTNAVSAHYHLGCVNYQWNALTEAHSHFQTCLEMAGKLFMPDAVLLSQLWLARTSFAQEDHSGYAEAARKVKEQIHPFKGSILEGVAVGILAGLALADGDTTAAQNWLGSRPLEPEDIQPDNLFYFQLRCLAGIRLLLVNGLARQAVLCLEKLIPIVQTAGSTICEVEALGLQALVVQAAGGNGSQSLSQALALAAPEGLLRPLLDLQTLAQFKPGLDLRPMLETLRWRQRTSADTAFTTRLLAAYGAARETGRPTKPI